MQYRKKQNISSILITKILISVFLIFIPFKVLAWDCRDANNYYLQPYAGVDAQWRITQPVTGYGSNLFKRHYLQGNIFLGFKICDYLGFELGYEITPTRTKTTALGPGDPALGIPSEPPEYHINKSRMHGWNIGIMGYYPVCNFFGNALFRNPFELLAYVGQQRMTCYFQDVTAISQGTPDDIRDHTLTFNETKSILRVGLGAQYTYCTSGIRFMVGYETTNQFKNLLSKEKGINDNRRLSLRNSMFFSLGVFVTIPF